MFWVLSGIVYVKKIFSHFLTDSYDKKMFLFYITSCPATTSAPAFRQRGRNVDTIMIKIF